MERRRTDKSLRGHRFRPAFDFDDLIQCFAVRARKGDVRGWPASRHVTPPIPQSFLIESTLNPRTRNCHVIVALTSQTSVVPLVYLPRLTAPRIWLGAFSLQCSGLKRRTVMTPIRWPTRLRRTVGAGQCRAIRSHQFLMQSRWLCAPVSRSCRA